MSVQAPAITGVSTPKVSTAADLIKWLRGIGVRQVRFACGLVMFSYIFSHFFNHALGNVPYALMEKRLTFHIWWWRIPVVNGLPCGCILTRSSHKQPHKPKAH
jgi:adenylate cyclase